MTELFFNETKIVILASDHDIASLTIAEQVENLGLPVFYLKNLSFLYVSDSILPDADCYIILSRHSSAAGDPAFTVHSVGNFSPDEPKLGGKAATLGFTQAEIQTFLLYSIKKNLDNSFSYFDVVTEATHHGPLLQKPVIFVEMGSNQEIWASKDAAAIMAKSLKYFFEKYSHSSILLSGAIGFGGGHYPRKIAEKMLALEYAVGHIIPKYALQYINEDIINQMITKTQVSTRLEYALFDKKGMNRKQEIREIVENLGLKVLQL